MPLPIQGGETALGLWRLRATLIMPTLVDDGAGGQIVDWAPGASFAAYRETAAMTEAVTVGLRTQALLTVLTWFRRDIKAETDFGVNARLQVTDGFAVTLYEIAGTREGAPGPSGEVLFLVLDLVALPDEPLAAAHAAGRRGAARHE